MARTAVLFVVVAATLFASAQAISYCAICEAVADQLVEKGGDVACDAVGIEFPVSEVCGWIVAHAAEELLHYLGHGYDTHTACKQIGLCPHLGNCDCGECSKAATGRCLSLPNKCPSMSNPLLRGAVEENLAAIEHVESGFCADGSCDAGKVGCCLTCF